jgi:hypothetical protein
MSLDLMNRLEWSTDAFAGSSQLVDFSRLKE